MASLQQCEIKSMETLLATYKALWASCEIDFKSLITRYLSKEITSTGADAALKKEIDDYKKIFRQILEEMESSKGTFFCESRIVVQKPTEYIIVNYRTCKIEKIGSPAELTHGKIYVKNNSVANNPFTDGSRFLNSSELFIPRIYTYVNAEPYFEFELLDSESISNIIPLELNWSRRREGFVNWYCVMKYMKLEFRGITTDRTERLIKSIPINTSTLEKDKFILLRSGLLIILKIWVANFYGSVQPLIIIDTGMLRRVYFDPDQWMDRFCLFDFRETAVDYNFGEIEPTEKERDDYLKFLLPILRTFPVELVRMVIYYH
ncbi:MAG: hypothetical protein Hyperionvirus1_175 [Hyperionvirus sp.]|uniref:Uncharacterized protein n=1 Tax=Hyperionvirus sp. TaxID=2487770 RepID=A0A3G5A5S6_9VIRU|nr:MAG: hypothetical protein Hyperionvirus1_175 [Hyperionvirus sp.]